jgi:proteic killer suppression protein
MTEHIRRWYGCRSFRVEAFSYSPFTIHVPCFLRVLPFPCSLTARIASIYARSVIKSFRHKGLEQFFLSGSKAGIQPKHSEKLRIQLFALNNARRPTDMNAPAWRLHCLSGDLANHWSIDVSGNWRVTFTFQGQDAILVDYQDYH